MSKSSFNRFLLVPLVLFGFFVSACSLMQAPTLEKAADYGNADDVRRHLNEGADVNQKNEQGQTPLHIAAQNGSLEVVEVLVERGAKVDARDQMGRTPLHLASYEGNSEVVDFLLVKKAQVNLPDNRGRTPLHHAALGNRGNDTALILISNKAAVDLPDHNGRTPLYLACLSDHPRMVEMLINKGAQVNPGKGPSPLMGAVREGHTDVVRILLENKARVQGPDKAPLTPLHLAAEKNFPDIANLLLDYKASPNGKDAQGKTPLYYAVFNDSFHVSQELLDKGVDVNQPIPEGTLLHLAAERGHAGSASLLIEKGARLEMKNAKGKKPLDVAIQHGNQRVADLIVREAIRQREIGK